MGPISKPSWPHLDMVWIPGLNWAWLSDCLPGMEWAPIGPQPASPVGPTLDIVGMRGQNWAWVARMVTVYGVGPIRAPTNKPSWAPSWICCGYVE